MERKFVLDEKEVIVRSPRSCPFNADWGHCHHPFCECECSADWNDSDEADFPECCPLKQKPDASLQMELDFAGKWQNLLH